MLKVTITEQSEHCALKKAHHKATVVIQNPNGVVIDVDFIVVSDKDDKFEGIEVINIRRVNQDITHPLLIEKVLAESLNLEVDDVQELILDNIISKNGWDLPENQSPSIQKTDPMEEIFKLFEKLFQQ